MSAQTVQAGESNDTTITIIETFSGAGGTVESAREVTLKTAIPTKVLMTCEIDKNMRESIVRRLNVPCHDDVSTTVDTKMPIASILVATPPSQYVYPSRKQSTGALCSILTHLGCP
jgi:hypothetical protein